MSQAVLFDLDGTLVNSLGDIAAHLNGAIGDLGFAPLDEATIMDGIGHGLAHLVKHALRDLGADGVRLSETVPLVQQAFLLRYRAEPVVRTYAYEGIPEVLEALDQRGVPMGVVSNKPVDLTEAVLAGLNLRHRFGVWFGGDSFEHRKPHPEPVLQACKRLEADPARCVFVGDSDADFAAGAAAGFAETVGCQWGFRDARDLLADGAAHVVDRPVELTPLLAELLANG